MTTNINATHEWSVAKAGPANVNIQNVSGNTDVEYAVLASSPTINGAVLKPYCAHPVTIGSGKNLYVRVSGPVLRALVVVVDA
jgi:hypothetical protein